MSVETSAETEANEAIDAVAKTYLFAPLPWFPLELPDVFFGYPSELSSAIIASPVYLPMVRAMGRLQDALAIRRTRQRLDMQIRDVRAKRRRRALQLSYGATLGPGGELVWRRK